MADYQKHQQSFFDALRYLSLGENAFLILKGQHSERIYDDDMFYLNQPRIFSSFLTSYLEYNEID